MFIEMEEFLTRLPSDRVRPINCFTGQSASGKTVTAAKCEGCLFLISVTDRPRRTGEPSHIDLEDFMFDLYEGKLLIPISRGFILQEYVHASPRQFALLEENEQFLWTYTSSRDNHYGTLKVLVQAALESIATPSIMIVSPEFAIWLAEKYPGRVNCFFFEPSNKHMQVLETRETKGSAFLRLQEERLWKKQAEESATPFVLVPGKRRPRDRAFLIENAIMPFR